MNDRTSEQLRQEALQQLRSRPRGRDEPGLTAHFAHKSETLSEGVHHFLTLAASLVGTNRYVEEWRQVRTPAEHDANTGLSINSEPEEFVQFLRSRDKSDEMFSFGTLGFSDAIPREAANYYTANLGYSGGTAVYSNNRLNFSATNYEPPFEHTLNLQEWLDVISEIVAWRLPLHIGVGSKNYPIYDAVFDHRAWAGWMGWFPVQIDPATLPGFALTHTIGPGTLVATQETNVITTDPAQVERANEVEIALAELGVLPTQDELNGLRAP